MRTKLPSILAILVSLIFLPVALAQEETPLEAVTVSNAAQVGTLNVLTGDGEVGSVAISPDGTLLAAGRFGAVQLWDAVSGNSEGFLQGHSSAVTDVVFSSDGTVIASVSRDATARLWRNLGEESISLTGHGGEVTSLSFNPSGTLLATSSTDGSVRLWDVMTGTLSLILDGHEGAVHAVAFSPVDNVLATGGADQTIRLWNVEDGLLTATIMAHDAAVNALVFSSDSRVLASASDDGSVRLWNVSQQQLISTSTGHEGSVLDVAFSPDGSVIASAGFDNMIRLWNASSGAALGALQGHENVVNTVTFDPVTGRLFSGGVDRTIRVWGSRGTSSGVIGSLRGDAEAVYNPNEAETCALVTGDGVLAVGQAETYILLYTNGIGCEGAVWLSNDALGSIEWLDVTPDTLPLVTTPVPPQIIRDVPEIASLCENPTDEARLRAAPPHTIFDPVTPRSMYPTDLLANTQDGIDVVLCMTTVNTQVDTCDYGEDIVIPLARPDVIIRLVNYADGTIAAQNIFEGFIPEICPVSIPIGGQITGTAVDNEVWLPWVIAFLQGDTANRQVQFTRTVVSANTANVRNGAGTGFRIIGETHAGDAVNIVARSSNGEWVVVMLPDLSFGWMSITVLNIADRTNIFTIPEFRGTAEEFRLGLP